MLWYSLHTLKGRDTPVILYYYFGPYTLKKYRGFFFLEGCMFVPVKKNDIITLWRTHDYDPITFRVDNTKDYPIPEETFKMEVNGVEVYSSKKVIRTSPFYLKRQ